MNKIYLTWDEVSKRAEQLAHLIVDRSKELPIKIYGVPRGGTPVALLIQQHIHCTLASEPARATVFVDDIVDSGATMKHFRSCYKMTPFYALYDKLNPLPMGQVPEGWLVFPWETERTNDDSIVATITNRLKDKGVAFKANDNIAEHLIEGEMKLVEAEVEKRAQALLESLLIDTGHCHNSNGTAKRMAKMYCREIFAGRYTAAPSITDFPNAGHLDEAYTTGPISVRSTCSHHMCPIVGKAWIGIIPGKRVIGLSKFNRLVEWVCSRPQIQEELVIQIADLIEKIAQPEGLAVVIKATHTCMTCRGVKENQDATMTTSVMRGAFRSKPEARAEFFALIK